MQADYKASGWLGIVTAGALWVPLYDAAALDTGVGLGLYPIVTFQYSSTTLYQVSYHIR
jgi:hypothetical protein